MSDGTPAQRFAEALTDLCKQHRMMIWTATVTSPIMVSLVADDEPFHYEAGRLAPLLGDRGGVIIRRVLDKAP